ncbi:collagen triple helix repeat-containing protein 1-like [Montipora capricornis]|uniref:collagen triple helix repeat-containing protein 1-like n=1 Tax=Montipora capricornis TaxID=246305 RepID=UPI0035F1BA34
MARILATMVLLVLYQETQTQRKINWGRRLCGQVEGRCRQYFIGVPGIKGNEGDPGPAGPPGQKGMRGDKGLKGSSYVADLFPVYGIKGKKGEPGYFGTKGQRGRPGRKGTSGDPGDKGDIGPKGEPGSQGFPGVKGLKGNPGISGSINNWKTCYWKHDPLQQYGLLKECLFNKRNQRSVLHVIFEGSMRVGFCKACCKRWFFAFDGAECQNANIEARLQGSKLFSGMEYRHVRLEGYCARSAGQVSVELWVEDCLNHRRAPTVSFMYVDVNPRITVEEITLTEI